MRIELGLSVECADGPCGTVGAVVVNPLRRTVTHVVVEPHHRHHLARLVPIEAVNPQRSVTALSLSCTTAELQRYPKVEDTAFVTLAEWPLLQDEHWEVGVSKVLALPFYDTAGLDGGLSPGLAYGDGAYMTYDRIPVGEVELRRGSPVEAADARTLGHVDGFVVDAQGRITHLALERGHLWGRRVTIPVAAVRQLRTDAVELELTADEVAALPSVRVRRGGAEALA